MMHFKLTSAVGLAVLLPLLAVGCATVESEKGGEARGSYPAWFFEEAGIFKDDGGHVIYAVGTSRNGPNLSTTRNVARQDARAEISRILGSHLQGMIVTYAQRAGDYYDPDTFSDTENFENVVRNLSESFQAGAQVVDSFFAEKDNAFCVLMRLDLEQAQTVGRAQQAMRESYASRMQAKQDEALAEMDAAFAAQDERLADVPRAFDEK